MSFTLKSSKSDLILTQVYVHPSPSAKDNIPGFIALIQQKSSAGSIDDRPSSTNSSNPVQSDRLLLAWVPESSLGDSYDTYVQVDLSDSSSPPITTHAASSGVGAYSFSTPVSNVYSLLIRPPSIGWWYGSVVINTKAG